MKTCLLAVFILAAALVAQSPLRQNLRSQDSRVNDTGPKGSLSGTVVDDLTGAPIRKARVNLSGPSNGAAVTDAAGAFSFEQVSAGNILLWAEHPDYPRKTSAFRPDARVVIAPGERKQGVEVRVSPAASLGGRITDADGDPMADCFITPFFGASRPMLIGPSVTGKDGTYTVERVPAGRYQIQARCNAPHLQPRPFAPPNAILPGRHFSYGIRYYPDALEELSAQTVSVTAGQFLRGLDFHMSPEAVSSLVVRIGGVPLQNLGRVQGSLKKIADGVSGIGARQNLDRGERYDAFLQPRLGELFFDAIRPGAYKLRIFTGGPESMLLASQLVDITEESKSLAVTAALPAALSGTVVAGAIKQDLPRSPASRRRAGDRGRVILTDVDDPTLTSNTEIKPDGSFSFRGVSSGHYRVSVTNGQWVQLIAFNGVTSDSQEIEIKQDSGGTLEIRTGPETGTVSGDLQGVPANVPSVHFFATSVGQPKSSTDFGDVPVQFPHYSLPLPPGRYLLYAAVLGLSDDLSSVLNNDDLASRGEEIDVRPGKELVRNLKVITADDIRKQNP